MSGNMYGFVDETWKPLAGKCEHDCIYCSTKHFKKRYEACKIKYSGDYRIDEKQLNKNLGSGKFIFVASTMDLFAEGVPVSIIKCVLEKCRQYDNTYLLQTKNPKRFNDFKQEFPENVVLGTTIETDDMMIAGVVSTAPSPYCRSHNLSGLSNEFETMVTIEPILDFDTVVLTELVRRCEPKWVNIGADSKCHNLREPSAEKVHELITELEKFTEVKIKSNLHRLSGEVKE